MSHPTTTSIVSGNIGELMGRNRTTARKLAAIVGCSAQSIGRRLDGEYPWDLDELDAICAHFDVGYERLLRQDTVGYVDGSDPPVFLTAA